MFISGSAAAGSAAARPDHAGGPGGRDQSPPGSSPEACGCDDGEAIATYEFDCVETECVEVDEETGECLEEECVDWDFVLADGDDVVDITYEHDDDTYNKDGEEAEPNYLEFDAEGYDVQSVCAYGGRDTSSGSDEDDPGTFTSDLENPGGQEAAISNVTFCGVESEDDDGTDDGETDDGETGDDEDGDDEVTIT